MYVIKKIIFLCIFLFCGTTINAQTSLNLYPINGVVGLKFFNEKKVSLEPRLDFQFDLANGESNVFLNAEIFTTMNFMREEKFNMYSGIGLGVNFYNQAQSNFCGSIPLGATYLVTDNKRLALVGECGLKVTASDFIKMRSYVLIGVQFRLGAAK